MSSDPFVDYYEVLQVSPTADQDTIERVFRHLAKRYHPDNAASGDPARFDLLVKAYRTLAMADSRATYDVRYRRHRAEQGGIVEESKAPLSIEDDHALRERLLSLLYVKRRRNVLDPGIGNLELERMTDCTREVVEFHLWYLKHKGWIELTDNGTYAITVEGVDQVEATRLRLRADRLLAEHAVGDDEAPEAQRQIPTGMAAK